MQILEGIVLIQSSLIFVRMFIKMKSRPELKSGSCLVKNKVTRSILRKACVDSRRHSFYPIFMKPRSLGQFLKKPYVHSREHSFDPIFMKLCDNVLFYKNLGQ